MAVKRWMVRHSRTNRLLGWLDLELGPETTDPRNSPRPYFLAVFPRDVEVERVPVSGDETVSEAGRAGGRKATVRIDTRGPIGRSTVWVDKASELHGHPLFFPWW